MTEVRAFKCVCN